MAWSRPEKAEAEAQNRLGVVENGEGTSEERVRERTKRGAARRRTGPSSSRGGTGEAWQVGSEEQRRQACDGGDARGCGGGALEGCDSSRF